jgi:hypothetical protein
MAIIKKILIYFNLLSLDVVAGAMAGMLFFSKLLEVKTPFAVYILLGLTVWIIYTLDHLMDAKSTKGYPHLTRHQFHQHNFRILLIMTFISGIIGGLLFFTFDEMKFIRVEAMILGSVTVVWMGFLRWGRQRISWLKEISTALIYVLGISLVPFSSTEFELLDKNFFLFFVLYFIAAWVNLLILSYLDSDEDQKDGFGSILVLISKAQLKKSVLILGIIGIGLVIFLLVTLPSFYHIHSVIVGLILGYHLLLFLSKKQSNDQIRKKSEASFLLPVLLLLL